MVPDSLDSTLDFGNFFSKLELFLNLSGVKGDEDHFNAITNWAQPNIKFTKNMQFLEKRLSNISLLLLPNTLMYTCPLLGSIISQQLRPMRCENTKCLSMVIDSIKFSLVEENSGLSRI